MNTTYLYAILSVLGVSLISLAGLVSIPLHTRYGKGLLKFMVSFSVGALLGDVFIHLFPELAKNGNFNLQTSLTILASIIGFFVFERFLHWHHHHTEDANDEANHAKHHPVVFLNLFGDCLHNFIDGLIIGGAYLINPSVGLATTLAVLLHEIPQEFGDFGILIYGGLSRKKALFYNFLSALTAVLGVAIALSIGQVENLAAVLVAVGIGSFIYIALADLIPELQKAKGRAVAQFFAMMLGIAVMFLLLLLD